MRQGSSNGRRRGGPAQHRRSGRRGGYFELRRFAAAPLAGVLYATSQTALVQQPVGAGGQIPQMPPTPVLEKSIPGLAIPFPDSSVIPVAAGDK